MKSSSTRKKKTKTSSRGKSPVLKEESEHLRRVMDLVGQVTAENDIDDVCRAIVAGVRDKLGFDRAGLFLWDEAGDCFRGTYGTSLDGETVGEHHLYWAARDWHLMTQVTRGDAFIEEIIDMPPPKEGEEAMKAYMVPLRSGERLYGLVSVDNRISKRPVSEGDLHYISLLGQIIGNTIDISPERDYVRFQKAYETLCRILDLLGQVTAQDSVDDICRTIVEGVRELLGFDRAGLHLWYEQEGVFRGTYGTDIDGKTKDEHDLWWHRESWEPWEKIKRGDVFIVDELDQPPPRPGEEKLKAYLVVLRFGKRIYGILSVDNRISRKLISEHELRYLTLFSRIVGNAVEISRTKAELARSAERFRQVAENSREWIWELDPEGRYTYCSPIAQEILGHDVSMLVGRPYMDFVAEKSKEEFQQVLHHALENRKPIQSVRHRQVHHDGHEVVLETSGLPVLDAEKQIIGYRGAHRDVSRDVEREEQLRQAQKLEAVGRLAGGVAHHFNNLLTVILGCGDLLTRQVGDNEDAKAEIEQIKNAGEQAASLTRQLLAFSRRQMLVVKRLHVNDVLMDIDSLLRRSIGEDIELKTEFGKDVGYINADADQLKHLVLRLAINARGAIREAMEKARSSSDDALTSSLPEPEEEERAGGLLIVRTAHAELSEDDCRGHKEVVPGRYAIVSVSDTGVGMPDGVREHIFEPFFTTKEVGSGTGLGLSSVYGAVKQMDGYVEVESSLGEGTTFNLYFPAALDVPDEPAASKAS